MLDFWRQLITFANSLEPDQVQQYVSPDLDSNLLTLWYCSWKNFLKKFMLKKVSAQQQKHEILPSMQKVNVSSQWNNKIKLSSCDETEEKVPITHKQPTASWAAMGPAKDLYL